MDVSKSSNYAVSKKLSKYSKRFNLPNIKAHAIRRAYAKNLLEKGASVSLISKALGHSDLSLTTGTAVCMSSIIEKMLEYK